VSDCVKASFDHRRILDHAARGSLVAKERNDQERG